jgi:hypothetical protein
VIGAARAELSAVWTFSTERDVLTTPALSEQELAWLVFHIHTIQYVFDIL